MKTVKVTLVAGCFALVALGLWPQDITVIQQSGVTPDQSKETRVVLVTPEGETADIYELLSESHAVAVGTGGSAGATGIDLQPVCEAPATLSLQGGAYTFYVSNNVMFGARFRIVAGGGTQTWQVRNPRLGEALVGTITFSLGLGTTIFGALVLATDTFDPTMLLVTLLGAGAGVGGYFLAADGSAHATLVKSDQ